MVSKTNANLLHVDWSQIPAPTDDGGADHLVGQAMPVVSLPRTDGGTVTMSEITGLWVLFAYPRTNVPGEPSLVDNWDQIPGARGCTPQSCAFRDLAKDLSSAGAAHVFGMSTQSTAYQSEVVARLHLPFPLLSDVEGRFRQALNLPVLEIGGEILLKRLSLIVEDGHIVAAQYPVFPPDQNAPDVLAWLRKHRPVAA